MNIMLSIISGLIMNMNTLTSGTTWITWYGDAHHGKKTASGETFDMNELTCASPYLPFGTEVLLENPVNNKSVTVKVNDRGPWKLVNGVRVPHPKRGFDVSKAAFAAIANPNVGTISVVYTILE
jgi:rare lipoprotein A